jgi:hypothetical protein
LNEYYIFYQIIYAAMIRKNGFTRTPLQQAFISVRTCVEREAWTLMTGGKRPEDVEREIKKMKKRL